MTMAALTIARIDSAFRVSSGLQFSIRYTLRKSDVEVNVTDFPAPTRWPAENARAGARVARVARAS
jgi:hypothetical protein